MLTHDSAQQTILATSTKTISWLIEIDTDSDGTPEYRYSLGALTWGLDAYTAKIMGFTPITISKGNPESGIIKPSKTNIKITNQNNTLIPADFDDATVTIRLVMDSASITSVYGSATTCVIEGADQTTLCAAGRSLRAYCGATDGWKDCVIQSSAYASGDTTITLTAASDDLTSNLEHIVVQPQMAAWAFRVRDSSSLLQVLTLECEDILTGYLRGDYPNTRMVSDLFPYPDAAQDNVCVPLAFGAPYFPLRWLPLNTLATYVDADTFTVDGDFTGLFAAGQFLAAFCGVDGTKLCYVDSSHYDIKCMIVQRDGTNNPYVYGAVTTEDGETYRITAYAKKKEEASVRVGFSTAHSTDGTYEDTEAPDDWGGSPTIEFDAVASGTTMYIYLKVITTNGIDGAYFDYVRIRKVTGSTLGETILFNGDFDEVGIYPWVKGNNAYIGRGNYGMEFTKASLTAASGDLTSNLTKIQTDHYLLGEPETYTITSARTPKDFGSTTSYTVAGGYTFKQETVTGADGNSYKAVQIIDDDSNIFFLRGNGGERYDTPFKFSRSDLVGYTNPADIVSYILQDWGIPAAQINSTLINAAADTHDTNGLTVNVGLYFQQARERLLCKLLTLGDMYPVVRDTIGVSVFDKTNRATITKLSIIRDSFRSSKILYKEDEKDSGYALWQSASSPQSESNKSLVSVKSGTSKPADDVIELEWIDGSAEALKAAILALQKLILPEKNISFTAFISSLKLEPGDLITIDDADLGGALYTAVIQDVTYYQEGRMQIDAIAYSAALDVWSDLAKDDITLYATDESKGYSSVVQGPSGTNGDGPNQITEAVLVGTGGEFKTNVDPAANGGMLITNESMTGYNTSGDVRFQAVYSGTDAGDVTIGDYAGGQGIKWDQSAGKMFIKVTEAGGIEVAGGGDITLAGSDTDPGRVKFTGTSYAVEIGGDADGNRFLIKPNLADTVDFFLGVNGSWWGESDARFRDIRFSCTNHGYFSCGDSAESENEATIEIVKNLGDGSPVINFFINDLYTGSAALYYMRSGYFTPTSSKLQDLGLALTAWDDAYADDWNNVADFYFLDSRNDDGEVIPVDDLEVIKNIKPSGVFDPRAGLELIDDNTLPEWLLTKHKKTGEIARDPDGKPYLSLKAVDSLLMGAIRQIASSIKDYDIKIENLNHEIESLKNQQVAGKKK